MNLLRGCSANISFRLNATRWHLWLREAPRVTATFVRVEQESIVDASQPQTVEYAFTEEDREVLEQAVLSAYAQSLSA